MKNKKESKEKKYQIVHHHQKRSVINLCSCVENIKHKEIEIEGEGRKTYGMFNGGKRNK